MWISRFIPHTLHFKKPATTSRGALTQKDTWFLCLENTAKPGIYGIGEAGTLPGLSMDDTDAAGYRLRLLQLEQELEMLPAAIAEQPFENLLRDLDLQQFPSISFALETALADWKHGGRRIIFDSGFSEGRDSIPINGLVWMDNAEAMLQQAKEKITAGFSCIKIKIGALDFDAECRLLESIRRLQSPFKLELRVDANGAFAVDTALAQLHELARFGLHSIEQPIRQSQWDAMEEICAGSKVPVALDEELIGLLPVDAGRMMKQVKPQYIVLKPSLLGGFACTRTWTDLAQKHNAGYWITSALEGNIGLNAIAQFTATLPMHMPQGLGTGQLFSNNIPCPLQVTNGTLQLNPNLQWDLSAIDQAAAPRP